MAVPWTNTFTVSSRAGGHPRLGQTGLSHMTIRRIPANSITGLSWLASSEPIRRPAMPAPCCRMSRPIAGSSRFTRN